MPLPGNVARDLLPVVNVPNVYNRLTDYAVHRIDTLAKELETITDPVDLYKIQGQIKELRRILSLRDEANADAGKKE